MGGFGQYAAMNFVVALDHIDQMAFTATGASSDVSIGYLTVENVETEETGILATVLG